MKSPKLDKVNNAFAEWGSFMHSIYERFYRGEMDFFDVCDEYENEYDSHVMNVFPYNRYADLNKKYYQAGLDAIERIEELPAPWKAADIECAIKINVKDVPFIGYADLILHNKDTDEYVIVDHKSKAKFKSKAEKHQFARQLYLYSIYVKEHYGKYPTKLVFNMFRTGEDPVVIPFNEKDLQEAIDWFTSNVANIYMDLEFLDKVAVEYQRLGKDISKFDQSDFFCNELCGVRPYCPRSQDYVQTDE